MKQVPLLKANKSSFFKSICFASAFASGAMSANVFAEDHSASLSTLYKSATAYDANLAAAKAAYLAEKEAEGIAQAGLRPTINASYNVARVDRTFDTTETELDERILGVTLSQPVFNAEIWHSDTAAEKNTLRAQANYQSLEQNLILEVAVAYFAVLRGEEDVEVAKAIQTAVKRQFEQAREQFEVGLIAITDVHEAQALLDDANTTRIRSEGALTIAKEQLTKLTGKFISELHGLKSEFPTVIDSKFSSEDWVSSAEQNNLQIRTAEFALENLNARYKASKAGHYPVLTFDIGYQDANRSQRSTNRADGFDPSAAPTDNFQYGFTLSTSLYSGGATQAGIRQTRQFVEQARFELEAAKRKAKIDARTEFINLRTNSQTVDALKQNIVSRESALEATREGYKVGTRNIVEVLDAERNYYTALRDHAGARLDFIESSLRLKLAAGTLSAKDIEELDNWLQPSSN